MKALPNDLHFYNDLNETITLEGYIADTPDVRRDHVKYTVWAERIKINDKTKKIQGHVLVSAKKYPTYEYGTALQIFGKLRTAASGEKFSYKDYLERYDIYSVMSDPKITLLNHQKGNIVYSFLFSLKDAFEYKLNQIYAEPHGSFMAGLLLGSRKGIPDHLMEKFNITGLTHIIAISGANITIIIAIILWFFRFLPRAVSYKIAIVFIILFTLLVGASAAVLRAAVMGIIGIIALNHGRETNVTISILFTAFLMVLWNPKILFFDVGFQLSFLAVMGLIYIAPHIEKWFLWIPKAFALRESMILTIAAQIAAGPIIIYNFSRFSLIAPLANILVGPVISFAMFFGFLAVALKILFFPFGLALGYIGYLVLEYMIWVVKICSLIPYASVGMDIGLTIVVVYYGVLILVLFKTQKLT